MKKLVFLFLAGFLILVFGATGYAQEAKLDFRASGFIDAQTHYATNVPPINVGFIPIYNSFAPAYRSFNAAGQPINALDKKTGYWSSRMHLAFDAVMGKEITGRVQFELDAGKFGSPPLTGPPPFGPPGAQFREAGVNGYWSADRTGVKIKYTYIDFALPYFGIPVPMTMRAGIQPLAIRPFFFVGTDGTGVTGGINLDPLMLSPLYFKPLEGFDWVADDCDVYGLHASLKLGEFKLGGYGLFYNLNSYPLWVATSQGFTIPSSLYAYLNGTQTANFAWLGFYADGKAGPININFDVAYDWGRAKSHLTPTTVAPNVKYSGWAARARIDYPWEKWNFGVTGMYASGSDTEKTSSSGLPGTTVQSGASPASTTVSTKVNGWMVPVGSEMGAVNNESAVFYGMEAGATPQGIAINHNYDQVNKGGFGGTWFAKLYTSYKVAPFYKLTLQGLYIGDTTKHGNTFGNALYRDGTLRDNKDIGWEFDWINEFQLYKNLVFKLWGGYMWAGDAMDFWTGTRNAAGQPINFSMKNPWAIRSRLLYTF